MTPPSVKPATKADLLAVIDRLQVEIADQRARIEGDAKQMAALEARNALVRTTLILAMHYVQTHCLITDERETLLEAGYLASKLPRPGAP